MYPSYDRITRSFYSTYSAWKKNFFRKVLYINITSLTLFFFTTVICQTHFMIGCNFLLLGVFCTRKNDKSYMFSSPPLCVSSFYEKNKNKTKASSVGKREKRKKNNEIALSKRHFFFFFTLISHYNSRKILQ